MSAAQSAQGRSPSDCKHPRRRTVWGNGTLREQKERTDPYEAAWCPDCGAFREASATIDAEPWTLPGTEQA
jgi:hypothetical protein